MPKKTKQERRDFTFNISLSVLNHLGRNLYRSFATVLGEAISNAWDADADSVRIYINKDKNQLFIKDDGAGMSRDDFQDKFLKIGYSKRKERFESPKKRPFIGRKGIGKLALLSCAEKITVISKVKGGAYIGGQIDNSGLDKAITDDLTPQQYPLGPAKLEAFGRYTVGHKKGTIIYFDNFHDGIKHSFEFLKKTIALYFRFSLLDDKFKIYIDDELVDHKCLDDLAAKSEFLWEIGSIDDPYVQRLKDKFTPKEKRKLKQGSGIKGFIASVEKPRDLKITSTDERVGIDLFVNGRLRERDILKHIPTARLVESYLYGQIHYDGLEDRKIDRFTSSREGVVADDPKYRRFLEELRDSIMSKILADWDKWRRRHKEDGDPENDALSPKERKSEELFNAVSGEYVLTENTKEKKKVDGWVDELSSDASFNFASYAECFISENLLRKYIAEKNIPITSANDEIVKMKKKEVDNKASGNVNIDLRQANTDLSYLDMGWLANLADRQSNQGQQLNCLPHDAKPYRPIRDALMHTARLTDPAKKKLNTVYENIHARIKTLLSRKGP